MKLKLALSENKLNESLYYLWESELNFFMVRSKRNIFAIIKNLILNHLVK